MESALAVLRHLWGGVGQTPAAPAWPPQCNATYLQFDSWRAYTQYTSDNAACLADFTACLTSSVEECKYLCLVNGPAMLNECAISSDTPCTVSGANSQPTDPTLPPYTFSYDVCLPRNMAPGAGCWEDSLGPLTDYFKYTECGPGLYSSPDCVMSVSCSFNHVLPVDPTWIVFGALGGMLVLAGGMFAYYRHQRVLAGGGDGAEDYAGLGEEDDEEEDRVDARRRDVEVGEPGAVTDTATARLSRLVTGGTASGGRHGADPVPAVEDDDPSRDTSTDRLVR